MNQSEKNKILDLRGEPCPEPQIEVMKRLNSMKVGETLEIVSDPESTDFGIPTICESRGYPCKIEKDGNSYRIIITKSK
ncbi:sulfurtransferase TusA family protein [Sulfuracidifex metallicus]|uniref:sulfurtransferase TusA family protein n=1 Tax=Sulfuracidifex metallicus TaxID=47303 RepID=UPI0022767446|nr:sulfurtransferase TusA family protein [Sulfuracidifex metallicus]MCY0850046.1 sulfurtransferase TusA family protein [Sulfuracidifex metallicus]